MKLTLFDEGFEGWGSAEVCDKFAAGPWAEERMMNYALKRGRNREIKREGLKKHGIV